MPINECEKRFFDYVANTPELNLSVPPEQLTVQHLRQVFSSLFLLKTCGEYADVSCSKQFIPARDGHIIPIRIFNHDIMETLPVLVMFPGTGYILDNFEINAIPFSRIAKASGIKVIMPEYRVAPENPLPISIYDAYDTVKYIATYNAEFNIDPNRIFIGGLSSGAHAAAVVSNLARNDPGFKIFHQILLNGIYDALLSHTEYDEYAKQDKWCAREGSQFMVANWGIQPSEYKNPLISPLYEKDLSGLPETTVIVGEYDGLRNDSEAYFAKVKQAGNKCQKIVLPGQSHTTMVYRTITNEGEDPAEVIAQVIKDNK